MRGLQLLGVLVMMLPQAATADVFARLSGLFGDPEVPEESCTANPVYSSFSANHDRVSFSWSSPVPSYSGLMITAFGGTVLWSDATSITMVRDHETRQTESGDKLLWVMQATDQPDGYCWRRIDEPAGRCVQLVRCPINPNS